MKLQGVRVFNGYVYALGFTESFGAGGRDVLLLKYDEKGNLLWAKTWGSEGYEEGVSFEINEYGIYLLTSPCYLLSSAIMASFSGLSPCELKERSFLLSTK